MGEVVQTEFLIVGAGPAGASLACFLSTYGLKGIVISASKGTADTPRAHITNAATIECLRDIGLEDEVMKQANTGSCLMHVRWCHSLAGEEFARMYAFGKGPINRDEYESASPCTHVDLPQTLLEPILVRYASNHGFPVRFQTKLLSFEETAPNDITATVRDGVTGHEYQIRTKYLFGADGARSLVVKQLRLPLTVKANENAKGPMLGVIVKTDLSHIIKNAEGNLHWVLQPDGDPNAQLGNACIVRMVKPWDEWMFYMYCSPGYNPNEVTTEDYEARIRQIIGDDTPIKVLRVSQWQVNEIYANEYSKGNVFCLGDAVHRHPPSAGLGSNTCIQDAYNLAWKVAYVHAGLAPPSLLSTYSIERQPIGEAVVTRANDCFRDNALLWEALGMIPPGAGATALTELASPGPEGKARRERLRHGVKIGRREFNGFGTEMACQYTGQGVYLADETEPFSPGVLEQEDAVLHHTPGTYPGRRLPHAWLNTTIPGRPVSTHDLAGHGAFSLFIGHGGAAWRGAAQIVAKKLGITISVHSIGFRLDWEDVYHTWAGVCGVDESGAVLVRPDRIVAWRAKQADPEECEGKLETVMRSVLGFGPAPRVNGTS
ncbi:FAD binding domain-containing protein [Echria macrotheca]|uniref:FAD binding domain-containing protein n=1 Tax=Echria macrotheca TaxID=438768 RepID=A0AAJ0BT23_9PEZI|nr:FAD binding domain-containing protein [Echria macrotheca]